MTSSRAALRLACTLAVLATASAPLASRAQVTVGVQVGLPVSPPLVVVQPGIQVVENYQEEVFFTRGWYWVHRGPYWYRARHPNVEFHRCEPRYVPAGLVRLPPGQYRHYRKAEVREARREEAAERKAWKHAAKAEKHHGSGHGDHGHESAPGPLISR